MLRVFKRFPKQTQVLSNINLSIHWGEFVCIQGEEGAGKSTLLKLMSLWEKPSHGQMVVDGVDVNALSSEQAFARERRLIRLTPEDGFFPKLNLKDNLSLAMDVAKTPMKRNLQQCMEMLAFVGLENVWHQTPPQLLPPQRLRLLLARALVRMPRMLLVDGCMDGMDEAESKSWLGALRQYQKGGTTVVVAGQRCFLEAARRFRLEGGILHTTG